MLNIISLLHLADVAVPPISLYFLFLFLTMYDGHCHIINYSGMEV
jgi:hypothetical protein